MEKLGLGPSTWSALVALALFLGPAAAFAQSSSDELARRHFESGAAYLEESDYDHALEAFQKAYELSKRPEILLNIATVHERKAELQPAVDALNQFLAVALPDDAHVGAVQLRIENLKKRLASEKPSAPAPPPVAAPPPAAVPAPAANTEPVVPPAPAVPRSRLPAFIAFGVGGVAAGAAVVTGIFASSDYSDAKSSCSPACSDSQLSSGRALALTSTILTGVAIAGVGVGVTLLLTTGGTDPAQTSLIPSLNLVGAPGAARAGARWRF